MLKKLFRSKRSAAPAAFATSAAGEAFILDAGARMLETARRNPDPMGMKDKLAEWAMQDEAFKVQLFRFIDVYPRLTSDEAVYTHLMEYLTQPGVKMPPGAAALLGMGAMAKGLVRKQIEAQVAAMGSRFIAGENARSAIPNLKKSWQQGIAFTADLLGEACVSGQEAEAYRARYLDLIVNLSEEVQRWPANPLLETDHLGPVPRTNVSIKVSSLCDKYDPIDFEGSIERCLAQLRPLLEEAGRRKVLVTFDVEQVKFKELNLALLKRCVAEIDFEAGLAMQAYLRSGEEDARGVIAWAKAAGKRITVRLVKGAYWDQEVIQAREQGWPVPVWTEKRDSDACFERMAKIFVDATPRSAAEGGVKLALGSHNLRSITAVLAMLKEAGLPTCALELQMLHGMGHGLKIAAAENQLRLREYVPVGELVPGMAYLVRRLLENTSNESWLLKGLSSEVPAAQVLASPHRPAGEPAHAPAAADMGLAPALAGVGPAFRNEPMRDFAEQSQRAAFAAAVGKARVPAVDHSATAQDAEKAVATAHGAFAAWRDRDPVARAAVIAKTARIMRENRDDLSALVALESAKVWREADADVCEAIDFCDYYALLAPKLFAPQRLGNLVGELDEIWHTPRGVAAVIAPWNFPLAICTGMTAAALATGNTVVVKPAEQTAGIALRMAEAFWQAGVPREALQFLPGHGHIVGAALVRDPKVANIVFTGSKEVGLDIWAAAGQMQPGQAQLKRVVCEMGGKNALIIDESADLDEAVLAARHSAFGFGGQKCSACSRLIVLDAVYDDFVRRFTESTKSLAVGDPRLPGTDLGPVIDDDAARKIREYIAIGQEEGTLVFGDGRDLGRVLGKPLIGPHIFADIRPEHRLAREEIFGPVVAVIRAKDFGEALAIANGADYKLTGGAFSRTPSHLARARREFLVGNLYLNRAITGALVGRHPFGGFGLSGGGSKAGSADYLLHFVNPRACAENTMRRGFAPGE